MKPKYSNSSPTLTVSGNAGNSSIAGRDIEIQKSTELDQIVYDMSASLTSMKIFVSQIQDRLHKLSYFGLDGEESKNAPTPEPQTTIERLRSLSFGQSALSQELEGIVNFLHRTV